MKAKMALRIGVVLVLGWIPLLGNNLQAEAIEDQLTSGPNLQRAWLARVANNELRLYPAQVRTVQTTAVLSADIPEINADDLVLSIVVDTQGRFFSNSLVTHGINRVGNGSLADRRSSTLEIKTQIAKVREEYEQLEAKKVQVNAELRAQAGMTEVDELFARANELEAEIQMLKKNKDEIVKPSL